MASIKKRKGSKVYQAQYYVSHVDPITGAKGLRQVRESTGKTRKSEALLVAAELERAARGFLRAGTDKAQQARAILATMSAKIERGTFNGQSATKSVAELLKLTSGNARNLLLGLRPLREPVARPEGGEKGVDRAIVSQSFS